VDAVFLYLILIARVKYDLAIKDGKLGCWCDDQLNAWVIISSLCEHHLDLGFDIVRPLVMSVCCAKYEATKLEKTWKLIKMLVRRSSKGDNFILW
jgi:hypothetical protein